MSNTEHLTTDIDANADQPNLGASLLEAALFGETAEPTAETGSVPATTPEDVKADAGTTSPEATPSEPVEPPPATEPTPPVEENADNSVVLAKDGKHTIPYERLQETREQVQQYKQQVEQLTAQLAAQQTPDNTQVAQQNAAVAEALIEASGNNADVMAMFGDFSEEGIAKGVNALVNQRVSEQVQVMIDQAIAPFKQQQHLSAEQQHFAYIGSAHPDYESIPESQEFQAWKDAQPGFIRSAYDDVFIVSRRFTTTCIKKYKQFKVVKVLIAQQKTRRCFVELTRFHCQIAGYIDHRYGETRMEYYWPSYSTDPVHQMIHAQ